MAAVLLIWRVGVDTTLAVKYCRFCISKGEWAKRRSHGPPRRDQAG